MIGIILHHVHIMKYTTPILGSVGYLATALFFFISGFGNTRSLNKLVKKEVKINWIWKKFLKLYIPFVVAYIIYYGILLLFYRQELPPIEHIPIDLFTISLPNTVNWFPKIILLCFLIHWFARKVSDKITIQHTIVITSICIYVVAMVALGSPSYWFNSVICYGLGCVFSKPERLQKMYDFLVKHKNLSFIVFIILFFLLVSLSYDNHILIHNSVMFCMVCFFFTCVFKCKSRFLSWIGNKSFEFYLLHLVWQKAFVVFKDTSYLLYTVLVIFVSIVSVYVYEKIYDFFKSFLIKLKR